jgi:hypothetical protein
MDSPSGAKPTALPADMGEPKQTMPTSVARALFTWGSVALSFQRGTESLNKYGMKWMNGSTK